MLHWSETRCIYMQKNSYDNALFLLQTEKAAYTPIGTEKPAIVFTLCEGNFDKNMLAATVRIHL